LGREKRSTKGKSGSKSEEEEKNIGHDAVSKDKKK
jgi:hypothetical protein